MLGWFINDRVLPSVLLRNLDADLSAALNERESLHFSRTVKVLADV